MSGPPEDEVFHRGEQALQRDAGSRERLALAGRRIVQPRLIEQHREFYARLPFVVLGASDSAGQPWASLLFGPRPGFVSSPDDRRLHVRALPAAPDPLAPCLREQAWLGLLGIELTTRRRNRANGRVAAIDEAGFTLAVEQSFGNCAKYIQQRAPRVAPGCAQYREALRASRLDGSRAELVRAADTFFIASRAAEGIPGAGADVSHRGGLPGFVRVADDGRSLAWPDFAGNRYFNTLGNLVLEPRAGLVFPDFESGDLLHVAGRARIVQDGACGFAGAQRALLLHIDEVVYRPAAMPMRWCLVERSPSLQPPAR